MLRAVKPEGPYVSVRSVMRKPYKGSPTRKKFYALRKAVRADKQRAAYLAEHTMICQEGRRRRHGKENQPCEWPIQFGKKYDGISVRCRRCGQLYRYYGTKWFKTEDYELGKHDIQKAERKAHEGDYGHDPMYAPWETPAHEPDCGYKDFMLTGLTRREQRTVGGPGVIKIGIAMVDREKKVRHWCRKGPDS